MVVDPEELQRVVLALDPVVVERFVLDVLQSSDDFVGMRRAVLVNRSDPGFDIVGSQASNGMPVVVEVKRVALLSHSHLDRFYAMIVGRRSEVPRSRSILITPGVAPAEVRRRAAELGIEVWDKMELARLANTEMLERYSTGSERRSAGNPGRQQKAEELKGRLAHIVAGREEWSDFQLHVSNCFEFLFTPPLGSPDYESADNERRNRRDFVMENLAEDGIWAHFRDRYSADYVAVDSKNSDLIGKAEVVMTAHYLKPYGLGMLAIVVCRRGVRDAAAHAIREQWIGGGKMIVAISDSDLNEMIDLRASGAPPEEVLRRKIAKFRKGL